MKLDTHLRYIGDPVLRRKSRAIEKPDAKWVRKFSEELLKEMNFHKAGSLSAPQIGQLYRMVALDPHMITHQCDKSEGFNHGILINPKIISSSEHIKSRWESSVSAPGYEFLIERPSGIRVEFQTLDGSKENHLMVGLLALVVQQQIDCLDGLTFVDKIDKSNPRLRFVGLTLPVNRPQQYSPSA